MKRILTYFVLFLICSGAFAQKNEPADTTRGKIQKNKTQVEVAAPGQNKVNQAGNDANQTNNETKVTPGASGVRRSIGYKFNKEKTDADPGIGTFRYNNDTLSRITWIYVDINDVTGEDQSNWYSTWDDTTGATARGSINIVEYEGKNIDHFNFTGVFIKGDGYWKFPVEYISGNLPLNGTLYYYVFNRIAHKKTQPVTDNKVVQPVAEPVSVQEPTHPEVPVVEAEEKPSQEPVVAQETKPARVTAPVGEEKPVQQPPVVQDQKPAEEPAPVQEEKPVPQPVVVQEQKPVEEPAPVREEKPVPQPVVVQEQKPVEEPAAVQEEKPVQQPVIVQEQKPVQEPVIVQEAKPVQEPVAVQNEKPVQQPVGVQEEKPVQKPVVVQEQKPVQESQTSEVKKPLRQTSGTPAQKQQQPTRITTSTSETRRPPASQTEQPKQPAQTIPVQPPVQTTKTDQAQKTTTTVQATQTVTATQKAEPVQQAKPEQSSQVASNNQNFQQSQYNQVSQVAKPVDIPNPYASGDISGSTRKKCYSGIIEIGYALGLGKYGISNFRFNFINGIRIGQYSSVGLGIGIRKYFDVVGRHPESYLVSNNFQVPIFLDLRTSFSTRKVSPYIALGIGNSAGYFSTGSDNSEKKLEGLYLAPSAGIWFRISDRFALFTGIAYEMQRLEYALYSDDSHFKKYCSSASLNVGISF